MAEKQTQKICSESSVGISSKFWCFSLFSCEAFSHFLPSLLQALFIKSLRSVTLVSSSCPGSWVSLSCAIMSVNFQTIPDNEFSLWSCSCAPACTVMCPCTGCVCDGDCFFFAGSQQSQDQSSRRSGNTGEKHNENGVRPNKHYWKWCQNKKTYCHEEPPFM